MERTLHYDLMTHAGRHAYDAERERKGLLNEFPNGTKVGYSSVCGADYQITGIIADVSDSLIATVLTETGNEYIAVWLLSKI
jgi:uncharacterized protein (UPF0128 family)